MQLSGYLSSGLFIAYTAYAVGTASPGPSNMAIMGLAMHRGRASALVFALGVVTGSIFWGLLAVLGFSAVLASYSQLLIGMKILGGMYLLWLAFKAAKSAVSRVDELDETGVANKETLLQSYRRGALMHLTNPKAIFVWLSIVATASPSTSTFAASLVLLCGCLCIGLLVFCGYALLFSTQTARSLYKKTRRPFNAVLSATFGYAGIRLLTARNLS